MRGLLKDISISELQGMRDSGMNNREIAESLGVSLSTVYRFIGAQPPGFRKPIERPAPASMSIQEEVVEDASLIVEDRSIGLAGLFAGYRINIKSKTVTVFIEDGVDAMVVPFDQVKVFAKELAAISRHMDELRVGNEAW